MATAMEILYDASGSRYQTREGVVAYKGVQVRGLGLVYLDMKVTSGCLDYHYGFGLRTMTASTPLLG